MISGTVELPLPDRERAPKESRDALRAIGELTARSKPMTSSHFR